MNKKKAFFCALNKLISKKCWGYVAGAGVGSIIKIALGKKIKRKVPSKNKHISEEMRNNTAEYSLLITCTWRLDSPNSIICSSKNSNKNDGPMVQGLKSILNRTVISVKCFEPAYDLVINFEGNYSLKIFCDETNSDEGEDFENYSFYTPECVFTIENQSKIEIE